MAHSLRGVFLCISQAIFKGMEIYMLVRTSCFNPINFSCTINTLHDTPILMLQNPWGNVGYYTINQIRHLSSLRGLVNHWANSLFISSQALH